MINTLKRLNDIGLWNFITVLLAGTAWIAGLSILIRRSRRIKDLNFCFFLTEEVSNKSRKNMNLLIRNQTNGSVIVSSPYIKLKDRYLASPCADNNSATNEFELKFEKDVNGAFTEAQTLIRPGDHVETILPLCTHVDLADIAKSSKKKIGSLHCNVIILKEKPVVIKYRIPVKNIQDRTGRTE